MRSLVLQLSTHLRVRAAASLSSPSTVVVLLAFGLAATLLWPGASLVGGADPTEALASRPLERALVWLLWISLWPAVPALTVRGRSTSGPGRGPLEELAVPAIPVGPSCRAVAEAILVLAVAAVVRLTLAASIGPPGLPTDAVVGGTLAGVVLMLPVTVAWARAGSSVEVLMLRTFAAAAVVTAGDLLGWYETWIGVLATSAGLLAGLLLSFQLTLGGGRRGRSASPSLPPRSAAARPDVQLRRDGWLEPLRSWGWWIAGAIAVYLVVIGLEVVHTPLLPGPLGSLIAGRPPSWALFVAFEVFVLVALQPLLRPLGSSLAIEGLVGKKGARPGDFVRAWSVLPVDRVSVLRRVWLHGLFWGTILWGFPTLMLLTRTWYRTGRPGLLADDGGDLATLILPAVILGPMLAGILVATAAGHRAFTMVAGLSLLVAVHGFPVVKILLDQMFGRTSPAAELGPLVFVAALALAASLPPLRLLQRA